jgi:alkylhydroperoxidase family enzyme
VSADQIAALDTGDIEAECFAEGERAVLQFTQEALRDVRVSNPTFAEVRELLGPREIVELLLTIGQYSMLARIMETLELDLDEPASVVESIRDPS